MTDVTRPASANENVHNILALHQLTESWLNRTYVGETQART